MCEDAAESMNHSLAFLDCTGVDKLSWFAINVTYPVLDVLGPPLIPLRVLYLYCLRSQFWQFLNGVFC